MTCAIWEGGSGVKRRGSDSGRVDTPCGVDRCVGKRVDETEQGEANGKVRSRTDGVMICTRRSGERVHGIAAE